MFFWLLSCTTGLILQQICHATSSISVAWWALHLQAVSVSACVLVLVTFKCNVLKPEYLKAIWVLISIYIANIWNWLFFWERKKKDFIYFDCHGLLQLLSCFMWLVHVFSAHSYHFKKLWTWQLILLHYYFSSGQYFQKRKWIRLDFSVHF